MAYFIRKVDTSSNPRDIRGWRYAIYKCDVCGEESEFKIVPNFQFRDRPCKHCGLMGKDDHINTLKREREEILSKIAELNSRLLTIETELSENKLTSEIETITNISKDLKNA